MASIHDFHPDYLNRENWNTYSRDLHIEYMQSYDEGKDVEQYKEMIYTINSMPDGEVKDKFADCVFQLIYEAPMRADYKYNEPSTLKEIFALCQGKPAKMKKPGKRVMKDKLRGAWLGRVCGCYLGKPVEGVRKPDLDVLFGLTNNSPLHRYLTLADITDEVKSKFDIKKIRMYMLERKNPGMPVDDDTNYTLLYSKLIKKYGKDFTPANVAEHWLRMQTRNAYCTAERVAYNNFINGIMPPESGVYKNKYREYIGAQIRADYFGYINPCNPKAAADMAFRDACISHVKNGIYGEMFVAAMLACAAGLSDIHQIIEGGLTVVPTTSRLYEEIKNVVKWYDEGVSKEDCFNRIHEKYDEQRSYFWCATTANAMICVASLLYGNGEYGKSICMAVETGFDTDCNGATVGSIIGMWKGSSCIEKQWSDAINETVYSSIFGVEETKIDDLVKDAMEAIYND